MVISFRFDQLTGCWSRVEGCFLWLKTLFWSGWEIEIKEEHHWIR